MVKLKASQRRKIARTYKSGWGIVRLAKEYEVSETAIKKVLRDGGLRIRAPGRPRSPKNRATIKDTWWEIWDLRREGLTYREIGELLGCSRQYCAQRCRDVEDRKDR